MLGNYIATVLRNLMRNRLTTCLNLVGLTLGLTAALLTLLYVRHETSFDRFIPGHEHLYVAVAH